VRASLPVCAPNELYREGGRGSLSRSENRPSRLHHICTLVQDPNGSRPARLVPRFGWADGKERERNERAKKQMASGRVSVHRRLAGRCLLPAVDLQFSNRKIPLLESHLSCSKQRIATVSNRKFLRPRPS
jgi:hypothetical protein